MLQKIRHAQQILAACPPAPQENAESRLVLDEILNKLAPLLGSI